MKLALGILLSFGLVFAAGFFFSDLVRPTETQLIVETVTVEDSDLSELSTKIDSVQIQLDNVLLRQEELGSAIFNLGQFVANQAGGQNPKLQCYVGKMQLVSPFTAPYMTGKAEPEQFNVVWEGWVDFCFTGSVVFGESYGPTGSYGGQVRPDAEPSGKITQP